MPNPQLLVITLGRAILEIFDGNRPLGQISRWVSEPVYAKLSRDVARSTRAILNSQRKVKRENYGASEPHLCSPARGVVEAVQVLHSPDRTRCVAIRLEAFGTRWRATAIGVL